MSLQLGTPSIISSTYLFICGSVVLPGFCDASPKGWSALESLEEKGLMLCDRLNSTLLKMDGSFVPDEAVLLSHFVLVGGVNYVCRSEEEGKEKMYINFRLVSNVEWSSDVQWNPIASCLSTSFFNQHWNEIYMRCACCAYQNFIPNEEFLIGVRQNILQERDGE